MKGKTFIILCLPFLGIGCANKKSMQTTNSPLATVIKLQAAEFLMDYKEEGRTLIAFMGIKT
jgi:hypothetical protein